MKKYSRYLLLILVGSGCVSARPGSVFMSKLQFEKRQEAVIESWLNEYSSNDYSNIGNWSSSANDCLRKIAAGLAAMKYKLPNAPGSSFPNIVESWVLKNVSQNEDVGTSGDSFDFVLIQIINLVHIFKDDPNLLTPTAIKGLVTLNKTSPFKLGYDLDHMIFQQYGFSFPETENHVLMLNIWRYLATEFCYRNDILTNHVTQSVENSLLEAGLLSIVGRIPQNGLFEVNARPYQTLTVHALTTLYSYADDSKTGGKKIKTATKNALDYIFLKFAFQSTNSKRFGGQRRNWDYRDRTGMNENDYMQIVSGTLTGINYFNDDYSEMSSQEKGYALWVALSNYRIPDPILDFYVNPDNAKTGYGFWARMQSRFTDNHYNKGSWSRYAVVDNPSLYHSAITNTGVTNHHGDPDLSGDNIEPAIELYFGTRDYLNSAGGHYDHFPALEHAGAGDKVHVYDYFTKPSTIIPAGNLAWGPNFDWENKVLGSDGLEEVTVSHQKDEFDCTWTPPSCGYVHTEWETTEDGFNASNNIGTYKNMMVGYSTNYDIDPISIPNSYGSPQYSLGNTSNSDFEFRIEVYEPYESSGLENYYVFVNWDKYRNDPYSPNYNFVIVEIIPKTKYADAYEIVSTWDDYALSEANTGYGYKSLVSGEILQINPSFASENGGNTNPFISIKNGGNNYVNDVHVDITNQSLINSLPLIEVRQVNEDYNFTGVNYAYSQGGGLILINNPRYGQYEIDSRNYLVPTTTLPESKFDFGPLVVVTIATPLLLN